MYRLKAAFIALGIALFSLVGYAQTGSFPLDQNPMELRYDRPAAYFEESLPIGNGKLGALVYGGADENIIYLNDITLWTGKPVDTLLDADAHQWIPAIREALFDEDYARADSLQLRVQGPNSQYYQPLGTLCIRDLNQGAVTGYHRSLNLDSSIVTDGYVRDGKVVERAYFASHPDNLIAVRLMGDIHCRILLTSQVPHRVENGSDGLVMTGHATGDPSESIHFRTILCLVTDGDVTTPDSSLMIQNASDVVLYIVNETSFNGFDKHPVREGAPYMENAAADLQRARRHTFAELYDRHLADYRQLYGRVKINLGKFPDGTPPLTDTLLSGYTGEGGGDRYLEELYFQFGRYLLISSSRTPGVPANLQGLWTPHLWSPWRGNYTVNINLEENYWPAFVANLVETARPLDGFVAALAANGRHSAKNYYGIDEGWCSSHNSDIWAMTNPVGEKRESPEWSNWNLGGAWLVNTLWERYQFTQDTTYLREMAYPLMKGAARFCLRWLIENPYRPGELITAPSTSPENEYLTDKGYHGTTCYGGTADLAIIRELFLNTLAAEEILGEPDEGIRAALERLHPYTVGRGGDLNEWYYDWNDWDPRHRHQSHLIGLYPGRHLAGVARWSGNPLCQGDSSLLRAAGRTLELKGDETTGWSTGWRINLWARLHEGERAYHFYRKLLTYVSPDAYDGLDRRRSGGTYPNLFDAHPPFQIDGNFGGTAGVCEMLMQSSDGCIELLPALPEAWSEGAVSGLLARGGYEVSFKWASRKVRSYRIVAKNDSRVTLMYNGLRETLDLKAGQVYVSR